MSDDWDVDSYKSEFENEEHWQLRRNFMLAHKDKFPEDELVCLAQAFTNVEFMGCRYPDETMVRIAELAKGVVEKFREQRKNCLKRTFVAASEAASAKAKGQTSKQIGSATSNIIKKIEKIEKNSKSTKEEIVSERISTEVDISNLSGDKSMDMGQDKDSDVCCLSTFYEKSKNINFTKDKPKIQLKNFVLLLNGENDHPIDVLQKSSSFNKCSSRWKFEWNNNSFVTCKFFLNDHLIATGNGKNMKLSKEQTAMAAVAKFRESHYAIKIKCGFLPNTVLTPAQLCPDFNPTASDSGSEQSSNDLGEDNIGRRIMMLMGWKGGGLGSQEQGIKSPIMSTGQQTRKGLGNHEQDLKNPVTASVKNTKKGLGNHEQDLKNPMADAVKKKKGLGCSSFSSSEKGHNMAFFMKAREFIKNWMLSNLDEEDLVFSTDFSSDERKVMHRAAKSLLLKSKSYGKGSVRHLVVSRKLSPWDIVEELLKNGGNSEKYELIYPTETKV